MANPFRPLKKLVFQKGGIGRSLSREETVERLNPISKALIELTLYYDDAVQRIGAPEIAAELERHLKRARVDVGKINETIFSAGGVAYSGTDLDPEAFRAGEDEDEMLFRLLDLEQAFLEKVSAEFDLEPREHQIRTQAVLANVRANSEARLAYLREITRKRRRPASV
ncbi:MAG: hypothetical protein D6685_04970 [Bacteroidetes bacterium]|nr:hypothetical protein AWN76_006060 [Rhodothermaceae bacterium RA]RMH66405.1 MAG: hypothetical protein D6685_04970 [Bacteroidota bacterium]